ncbi:MAG: type II secretion system protein, partial [Candidatus Rifleibacteriota bacterium]
MAGITQLIKKIRKNGFTLIELMIVVAIIAVLLAMAAYSFSGIRNRIRKTSCRENMRIIRKAFFLAQTENPSLTDKDLTIDKLLKLGYLKTRPI